MPASRELVTLVMDGQGTNRYISRDMIVVEARLQCAGDDLAGLAGHGLPAAVRARGLDAAGSGGLVLGGEQRSALAHITRGDDLSIMLGYAGTDKSAMLGLTRDQWECAGYSVRGAALSDIAA